MGSGSRDKDAVPTGNAPFHSPFRDLGKALRDQPRAPSSKGAGSTSAAGVSAAKVGATAPRIGAMPSRIGTDSTTGRVPPSAATPTGRPTANSDAKRATPATTTADDSQSDATALAAAVAGAKPLGPSAKRVLIRRPADLTQIDAARREHAQASARDFEVTTVKDHVRGRVSGVKLDTLLRLERGDFAFCAHLDLHGMTMEKARTAIDEFLAMQQKQGQVCVRIVTGRGKNSVGGQGVLREQVPQWLMREPSSRRVLAFASARPSDGGIGALAVLMRGTSSSKN